MSQISGSMDSDEIYIESYDDLIDAIDRLEELEETEEVEDDTYSEYEVLQTEVEDIITGLALAKPLSGKSAKEANNMLEAADQLLEGNYGEVKAFLRERYEG